VDIGIELATFSFMVSSRGQSTTPFGLSPRCVDFLLSKSDQTVILSQGASILTGLGFTGFSPSGDSLWDGAANVKVLSIELPSNFKILLDSWNMKTNVWLRECVYKRVTPKGKKPGFRSSMITFATSAFWVSFYPIIFSP
jgi:MBOAT, membrane-bound O-acyltransferase family